MSTASKPPMAALALALALVTVVAADRQNEPPAESDDQPSTVPALAEDLSVGDRFRDCAGCPEMVVVPAGSFRMGSKRKGGVFDNAGPVREVMMDAPFAVGVHEVTVAEFGGFVDATSHATGRACWTHEDGERRLRTGRNWRNPGFPQEASHPVVCVNWHDGQRYVAWLSSVTGQRYRLPSEAEWEYVVRAGSEGVDSLRAVQTWWISCEYANHADASGPKSYYDWELMSCNDGHPYTAPVGSFPANAWGLHDVFGNAAEWNQDCWNDSYTGAPTNGSAWESGDCKRRVLRGGAYSKLRSGLRASYRDVTNAGNRADTYGFRVARALTP